MGFDRPEAVSATVQVEHGSRGRRGVGLQPEGVKVADPARCRRDAVRIRQEGDEVVEHLAGDADRQTTQTRLDSNESRSEGMAQGRHVAAGRAPLLPTATDRGLRSRYPGDRDAVGRAGDVVESRPIEEIDR